MVNWSNELDVFFRDEDKLEKVTGSNVLCRWFTAICLTFNQIVRFVTKNKENQQQFDYNAKLFTINLAQLKAKKFLLQALLCDIYRQSKKNY